MDRPSISIERLSYLLTTVEADSVSPDPVLPAILAPLPLSSHSNRQTKAL